MRKVISDVGVKFAEVAEAKVVAEGASRRQWWCLSAFWMMHFRNLDRHQHFGIVPDYLNGLTGLVSELQSLQSIYMASSDFRGF